MELSEILGGADAPVEPASTVETPPAVEAQAPAPVEPTTTVEQPAERPRNEQGRFVKAEEPQHEERSHTVPVQALLEERRKRQELEQQLAQQQKPKVDDDQFWTSPSTATQQVVKQEVGDLQQQIVDIKYQIAEDLTRQQHADYDAVRDAFIAKVHSGDPYAVALAQQMGSQPNPARFVYEQSKRLAALEQVGDLGAFEARIRAEERARMLQESNRRPAPADVPRSLNSEPSAPSLSTSDAFLPTPLESLIGNHF
jgi:hypothetical protein